MTQSPFFTTLKDRGLIKISGPDRYIFLQKLITNDVAVLNKQDAIYACLLSPGGKFLYDFFVLEPEHDSEVLYIECEGGERAKNLGKKLKRYKQNSNVEIEIKPKKNCYAVLGLAFGYNDPRHKKMGYRSFGRPAGIPEQPFEEWDYLRISLGIPDGSRDMIAGKTSIEAARIALFNGLSYEKSTYIGHKETMRKHYCGLSKKYLQCVKLSEIQKDAELRSSCKDLGIVLMKHAAVSPHPPKQRLGTKD